MFPGVSVHTCTNAPCWLLTLGLQASEAERIGVGQVAQRVCPHLHPTKFPLCCRFLLLCRPRKRSASAWIKWPRSCPLGPHPAATSVSGRAPSFSPSDTCRRPWFAWVHEDDSCGMVLRLLAGRPAVTTCMLALV